MERAKAFFCAENFLKINWLINIIVPNIVAW
jgi:hypothetical protein